MTETYELSRRTPHTPEHLHGECSRMIRHDRKRKELIGQFAGGAILLAFLPLSAGCQSNQPPAAESGVILTPDDARQRRILDDAQQADAIAAMRSVAAGHQLKSPPSSAAAGVRWSDLHAAVIEAATELEMAVFGRHASERGVRYAIRTIDGHPVTLDVERLDDDRVYRAEATVGRFRNEQAERALLDALDKHMRQFGRKRGFEKD